jgi:DNA-binding NarL/FixJ family response regulator
VRSKIRWTGDLLVQALLVDDRSFTRPDLIGLISGNIPEWSFLRVGCLSEAMAHLDGCRPGEGVQLLIVDLHTPGMPSASIRVLREIYTTLRIAIVTGVYDRDTNLSCLAAGAHGYLIRTEAPEQLVHALRTIMRGEIYVPPRLAELSSVESAIPLPTGRSRSVSAALTARQQEVLTLLNDRYSTKDIARHLNLGIGTVKVHLSGIYRALGVRNRREVTAHFPALGAAETTPATCRPPRDKERVNGFHTAGFGI